jgi:outer membrane protein TolC
MKPGGRTFAAISLTFLATVSLFAESPSALQTLVDKALVNDPNRIKAIETLRAAEADAAGEKARRLVDGAISATAGRTNGIGGADSDGSALQGGISAATLLPAGAKLSVGTSYQYSMQNAADTATTGEETTDSTSFSAGVKVPVFVNGKPVDTRLEKASRAAAIDLPLEAAREAASDQERYTVDAVLRLALDAASADRACFIAQRNADIAKHDANIARVKREQGLLGYADLSKIEKDANEERVSALEARFLRDKKIRALAAATGEPENGETSGGIDLAGIVAPEVGVDPSLFPDSADTPDMRKAARARKNAEMNLILAGSESAPTFEVSASASVPGPSTRAQKAYDPDAKGTWTASAGINVPLPTGAGSAKVKAADARLAAARQEEIASARSSADTLEALRNAWITAGEKIKLREQLVEQAEARLRDVQSSFETQTATKLDVDRARLTSDDAASSLEDDKSASFKALLDLYSYCGLDPRVLLKEERK